MADGPDFDAQASLENLPITDHLRSVGAGGLKWGALLQAIARAVEHFVRCGPPNTFPA